MENIPTLFAMFTQLILLSVNMVRMMLKENSAEIIVCCFNRKKFKIEFFINIYTPKIHPVKRLSDIFLHNA